jgi:S1-C subfamily serine protease
MSEFERPNSEPAGPTPDQSLLPPPPPEWPSPAQAPAPPPSNSLWHRLAAGIVVAAVVAAAAGAGIGWSLARAITPQVAGVPTITAPASDAEAPIQATKPSTGTLDIKAIAAKVNPAVVDINTVVGTSRAAGTGMIVTSSGEILTNNHVVDGSTTINVTIAGYSQPFTAHVVGVNPSADVAVIQIDGTVSGLPTVSFARSSSLQVGDMVVAIGNALGQGGAPSVTQGSITALDQSITASSGGTKSERLTGMIQTDATIYPGDSGGPLVNSAGQVIGMITAGQVQGFRSAASSVNYAVASDTMLDMVNQIRSRASNPAIIYGQVGYIGVSAQTLDSATAAQLGLSVSSGALVRSVIAGSPADTAGITRGGVITSVGGTPVTTIDNLGTAIRAHKPGEKVSVSYVDQSGTHTATVTLGAINP